MSYIIRKSDLKVELWSSARLPFEPTGWKKEMRNELRNALRSSRSSSSGILYSYFASTKSEFVDIENILFYNIGAGAYRHLGMRGIVFGKSVNVPHPGSQHDSEYDYYQCYFLSEPDEFLPEIEQGELLAEWNDVVCPILQGEKKPHTYWYTLHGDRIKVYGSSRNSDSIGIRVVLHAPSGASVNIAGSMKSMLDGLISGFHTHDGSSLEYVSDKLADYLRCDSHEIKERLSDDSLNVLGKRSLVGPFRDGIKWNPADERVLFSEILIGNESTTDSWAHEGQIFCLVQT